MKKTKSFIYVFCCAAALTGTRPAFAAEPTQIHFFGNSLTDQVRYDSFKKLCDGAGHPLEWNREMAPGVPVHWHWDKKPKWEKKLTEQSWDAVTLQPFGNFELEYQGCMNFARFLAEKQPEVQLFIYAQWHHRGTADWTSDFLQTSAVVTDEGWDGTCRKKTGEAFWLENVHAAAVEAGYPARLERSYKNRYELTVQGLNAAGILKKTVKLIPVGHVLELLSSKMRAGMVPGYASPYQFYFDNVHLDNVGCYIVACTFYATIFQASPVGLPVGEYQGGPHTRGSSAQISDELARVIQETVWEVVASHPLTGVTSGDPVRVATAALNPAIQGEPYQFQVHHAFGKAPHRWRADALPAGLTLSGEGLITGTPTAAPGERAISFVVTDADGKTAAREIPFVVEADTAPKITTTSMLPDRRLGEHFALQLEAEGGNGALLWELAERNGTLPPGLMLNPDGTLSGAPGMEGTHTFAIKVTDSDRGNPETDTARFTLQVGPPAAGVFRVRAIPRDTKFKLDGVLDEPFWDLKEPITKLVLGEKATVQAWFDVVRQGSEMMVAVKVIDPNRHISKTDELWNGDSVELFLDVLNNREEVYNFDDRRIVVADKKWGGVWRVAPESFGHDAKIARTEDGYTAEFRLRFFSLAFSNRNYPAVMGFDIAVNDDNDGTGRSSQVVWQGTKDNDTVPRFGTIIFEPDAKAATE